MPEGSTKRSPGKYTGGQLTVQTFLPVVVVEWLDMKASSSYKSRSKYIRDLLVAAYRREHPDG